VIQKSKTGDVTDESGSVETEIAAEAKLSAHEFLKSGRRDLSEEEIRSATSVRFLISELEKSSDEISRLRPYVDKYHEADKNLAVIRKSLESSKWNEILAAICLAVGSAGLGAAPSYSAVGKISIFLIVFSLILIVASIIFRAKK
jgi:hypothetical protein